ncbi:MAG: 16S rRNA (guanine(966)-N(2))-methyltransferase RsmD [Clostridia bacterium]|nr:16S rRNA (guanine(966)-N(2))-methyltransferase RsmD [Clostridia bacterium]
MRIVAGKRKGLIIKTIEGESTRPTRDMVREALFSILTNDIMDARFLDLFAGSGAIGIEALSRGAQLAVFSDLNPKCTKVIKENIEKANFTEESSVYTADYKTVLKKLKESKSEFDIIFIDPPYHKGLGIDSIYQISEYGILAKNGIIIFETDTNEEVPEVIGDFIRYNYKRYGRNMLNLFKRKG